MKRSLTSAIASLLLLTAGHVWAVRQLPFHTASWITWINPDVSAVDLYGGTMDGLSVYNYAFGPNNKLVQEDAPLVDNLLNRYSGQNQGGKRPIFLTIVNDRASGTAQHEGDIQFDGPLITNILSNPTTRAQHIADILALPALSKVDGVEIDYEALEGAVQPYYTQFIAELSPQLKARGKLLAICAQPKLSKAVGPRGGAIDWPNVVDNVDEIRILAYYYSYPGSVPGPVVSNQQVTDLTNLALTGYGLPILKTHIVFSLFGLDWPMNGQPGRYIEYKEAMQIAQQYGVTPTRDANSNVVRINYTDGSGVAHQIWIDDFTSLQPKIMTVLGLGIRHVDFWHLGTGDPAIWTWVAANTTNVPDPADNVTPVISQLKPNFATPGSAALTVDILGSNYEHGAKARWNGGDRVTTFVDATHLQMAVLASDLAAPTVSSVTVFNPVNNKTSNVSPFFINARPVVTTLSPSSIAAGSGAFTLTLTGTGFSPNSLVRWNAEDRPTTYVSATQLKAAIPARDVLNRGVAQVTVSNPVNEGGLSQARTFSIRLTPSITALSPGQTTAGGPAFTLIVQGNGFASDSAFVWNGSSLPVQMVSTTTLKVSVGAANIATAGRIPVFVSNPAPGGISEVRQFIVNAVGANVPTILSLNPSAARPGSPAVTMQVTGRNFLSGAVVEWEGAALQTVFVSSTQVTAVVPATYLTTAGKYSITVTNPQPKGGTSAAVLFAVSNSATLITSVTPSSVAAGGPAFVLTINGIGFSTSSVVTWNGAALSTQFASNAKLTANVPAANIVAPGPVPLSVQDPAGNSQTYTFYVDTNTGVTPGLIRITPSNARVGGTGFAMTVTGKEFTQATQIQWNGIARLTTFVSTSTLTIQVSSPDLVAVGTATITAATNGGALSNALVFQITAAPVTPSIYSLSPSSAPVNGTLRTFKIFGLNFSTNSIVQWNSTPRVATLTTPGPGTQTLTVQISSADLSVPTTAMITVIESSKTSNAVPFVVYGSSAVAANFMITAITPSSATAGGAGFTMTVTGQQFSAGASALWNGAALVTQFVSSTTLTATVPAANIALPGISTITVQLAAQTSNKLFFVTASSPTPTTPTLALIQPSSGSVGSSDTALLLTGTGFGSDAQVLFDGAPLSTTFVSSVSLTAVIPASDFATAGLFYVSVKTNAQVSNPQPFTVVASSTSATPVLYSMSPSSAPAGSMGVTIVLNGANFTQQSTVRWNGADRPTTFSGNGAIQATIPATDLSQAGNFSVTVFDPAGGTTAAKTFSVYVDQSANGIGNLRGVRVFPNPWAADTAVNPYITFDNLTPESTIKIFTLSARAVKTLQPDASGIAHWDLANDHGERAASGYYLYVITNPQGDRLRGKLAIVR